MWNIGDRIYRKVNFLFWHKLKPGKWALCLYPSYRHYLRYKSKLGTVNRYDDLYLTQKVNTGAGIGHQLGNWLSGYCAAKKIGLDYVYAPFPNVSMGEQDSWDYFLGFNESVASIDSLKKKGYKIKKLPYFDANDENQMQMIKGIIASYALKNEKIIFNLALDQYYRDVQEALPDIKEMFEKASSRKNDKLIFDEKEVNIAVHIRRGDIVAGQSNGRSSLTKRWLDNKYYADVLQQLCDLLDGKRKYRIYIFSQGEENDFPELMDLPNMQFCLQMPAKESFLHMIRSDILITSKSSFSYKPALLADGIRICPKNFWHGYPNDEKWILLDENNPTEMKGKVNFEEIKNCLCRFLE